MIGLLGRLGLLVSMLFIFSIISLTFLICQRLGFWEIILIRVPGGR